MRAASRMQDSALSGGGMFARLLRNGIPAATAVARACMRWGKVRAYFDDVRWLAVSHGYETGSDRAGGVLLVAVASVAAVAQLVSSAPAFSSMLALCLAVGVRMAARQAHDRQREAMREQVPDMLHAMSACFHAGYSLQQTFQQLARETQGRLQQLFRSAASDVRTGRSATEALRRMREDAELPELAFVTAALEIQHQTGGSLQKIIDSACDSVEGELALRRSLRVQTAQARLSMRVVTVMPFALIALFSLVSPGFLAPFFATPVGIAVFGLAMGMQVAGVFSVRRMLDVKED
jgi:tight adherence protein B